MSCGESAEKLRGEKASAIIAYAHPSACPGEKTQVSAEHRSGRPLSQGVEDPNLRPVDRLFGDEFFVARGDLVLVVRFLAIKNDDQSDVEFLIVHWSLVGRFADAGT